jgi:hypothetical protein
MSEPRDYIEGVPQATKREREWTRGVASLIVDVARRHQDGIKGDADELEGQIARELRAAVAQLNGGI